MNKDHQYKKKSKLKLIMLIIAAFLLAVAGSFLAVIYNSRPVLIVSEQIFLSLYGEDRVKRENLISAITLLRTVKTVSVANDAGDDIVSLAVTEVSAQPYCVIFPLRFAMAAKIYREENPDIPVIILEGRYPVNARPSSFALGNNASDYYIFKTDIETDFYKAGIAAAVIITPQKTEESAEQPVPAGGGLEESLRPVDENQPKKQIFIFWGESVKAASKLFKEAIGDFILERTPVFSGQIAINNEQLTINSEQLTINNEQLIMNSDQSIEGSEQLTENSEQLTGNSEQLTENGEQSEGSSEQLTENSEQLKESGEQSEGSDEKVAESGGREERQRENRLSAEALESEELPAGESETDAGNGEFAAESEEDTEEEETVEETVQDEESSDDDFNPLLPEIRVFSTFLEYKDTPELACVVMVDGGSDFFDKKSGIPVIAFSWLNPGLMPDEAVLIIDDSPWVQVVRIVKMVKNKVQYGVIASKFHFLNKNIFNRETIRKIKKSWKNAKIEF